MSQSEPFSFEEFDHTSYQDCRILVIGESEFTVSATYISMFSRFFKALFFGEFREATETRVILEDIDSEHFRCFLNVIYPCHRKVSDQTAASLMTLAYRFEVPYLIQQCDAQMLNAVLEDRMSILVPLELAHRHGALDKCMPYLTKFPDLSTLIKKTKGIKDTESGVKLWLFNQYCEKIKP